ncbi:hypothetical protein D9M68_989190 [compost metagenome]
MNTIASKARFQPLKIALHQWLDIGVETGDQCAFIFADFWPDRCGGCNGKPIRLVRYLLRQLFFNRRIGIAIDQDKCCRIDIQCI